MWNGVLFYHSGDGVTIPLPDDGHIYFHSCGNLHDYSYYHETQINCTNSTSTPVIIQNTVPQAAFVYTQACVNEQTMFNRPIPGQCRRYYNRLVVDLGWWFRNRTLQHTCQFRHLPWLPHVFTDLLSHEVTLKVMNSNGCVNTTIQIPCAGPLLHPGPTSLIRQQSAKETWYSFSDIELAFWAEPYCFISLEFWWSHLTQQYFHRPEPTDLFSGPGTYHVKTNPWLNQEWMRPTPEQVVHQPPRP